MAKWTNAHAKLVNVKREKFAGSNPACPNTLTPVLVVSAFVQSGKKSWPGRCGIRGCTLKINIGEYYEKINLRRNLEIVLMDVEVDSNDGSESPKTQPQSWFHRTG